MGDTKTKQKEEQFQTTVVEGFQLSRTFADGKARMRDVELGEELGYPNTHSLRKLFESLFQSKRLNRSEVMELNSKTSVRGGRPGREFWPTREQALLVIIRSDQPAAIALTAKIIAVFEAYLDGKVRPANDNGITLEDVRGLLAPLYAAITQHSHQIQHLYGCASLNGRISLDDRCLVAALKCQIARKEVEAKRFAKLRQANSDIQRELREATGWGGKNERQADMPAGVVGKALTCLRNRLDAVNRQLQTMKQTGFDFGEN